MYDAIPCGLLNSLFCVHALFLFTTSMYVCMNCSIHPHRVFRRSKGAATVVATNPVTKEHTACSKRSSLKCK